MWRYKPSLLLFCQCWQTLWGITPSYYVWKPGPAREYRASQVSRISKMSAFPVLKTWGWSQLSIAFFFCSLWATAFPLMSAPPFRYIRRRTELMGTLQTIPFTLSIPVFLCLLLTESLLRPHLGPRNFSSKDIKNTSSHHFQVSESQVKLDHIKMAVTCYRGFHMTCCHGALTCQCWWHRGWGYWQYTS